jgi:type II secretory pathway component PulK
MILRSRSTRSRPGIVLLAVLVVVVLLTLAAYQYSELMMAEYKAADSYLKAAQTRALADSGIHYVAALLSDPNAVTNTLNGNPYENPTIYQDVLVMPDPNGGQRNGRFSVVALRNPDDPAATTSPYRFGVADEAGKINLNSLLALDNGQGNVALTMLMNLPNMTEDIANAILDWLDPDDTPRTNGAENDYYTSLDPPYQCKNGPLDSLEELLLVKGVTPPLLFGNDTNRNGILDPDEDDGSGQVDLGWSAYLTVYSRELNVDFSGNPRVYLNDSDLNTLATNLTTAVGQDLSDFIIAYRLYGPSTGGTGGGTGGAVVVQANGTTMVAANTSTAKGGGGGGAAYTPLANQDVDAVRGQMQTDKASASGSGGGGKQKISTLYELITAKVDVPVGTGMNQRTVTMSSPLSDPGQQATLLPLLLDETTTTQQTELSPRININTASQMVLTALPGLTGDQVQTILDTRPPTSSDNPPDASFQTPAWLVTQASLPVSALQQLENYVTARTFVYRVQSVGYYDSGGATSRVEAVIDTNLGRPRIVYWRDLSALGKGFPLGSGSTN